jgi:hypothetical protein
MRKHLGKWSDRAIKADGLWSFVNMVWSGYTWFAAAGAGMMAFASTYIDSFWSTYGWAGVIGVAIIGFAAIAFGLNQFDLWWHRRRERKRGQGAKAVVSQAPVYQPAPSTAGPGPETFAVAASKLVPMDVAVRYISRESQWILSQQNNPQWPFKLQQDLHDSLRQGLLTAYGRAAQQGRIPPEGFKASRHAIGNRTWQNNRPWINDGLNGNDTANAAMIINMTNTIAYYDIQFESEQIRTLWPPLDSTLDSSIKPLKLK